MLLVHCLACLGQAQLLCPLSYVLCLILLFSGHHPTLQSCHQPALLVHALLVSGLPCTPPASSAPALASLLVCSMLPNTTFSPSFVCVAHKCILGGAWRGECIREDLGLHDPERFCKEAWSQIPFSVFYNLIRCHGRRICAVSLVRRSYTKY